MFAVFVAIVKPSWKALLTLVCSPFPFFVYLFLFSSFIIIIIIIFSFAFFCLFLPPVDQMPLEMKAACSLLKKEVQTKFPQQVGPCLGGFIFLRFFCPAIASPARCGLTKKVVF